jgi:hypothetical protein
MVMLSTHDKEEEGIEGGQYARNEEELYSKAVALLEKCKIASQPSDRQMPETTAEIPPLTV